LKKRELRKAMRDLKKKKISRKDFIVKRREYKECKIREKEHAEEEEVKIRSIRSEAEAWKYINKYKDKRAERISEDIEMDEWRGYFMEMLRGTQEKIMLEIKNSEEEEDKEEVEAAGDIMREEIIEVLKKLKREKAPGEDGIENEAWRYMSKELGEKFWKL